jgi:hypothetical protein
MIRRRLIWLGGLGAMLGLGRSPAPTEAATGDPLVLDGPFQNSALNTTLIQSSSAKIVLDLVAEGAGSNAVVGLSAVGGPSSSVTSASAAGLVAAGPPPGPPQHDGNPWFGIVASGGDAEGGHGGVGVFARGGIAQTGQGGDGLKALGGHGAIGGGRGLLAEGGLGKRVAGGRPGQPGAAGIEATGGSAQFDVEAGAGVFAQGGWEAQPDSTSTGDGTGLTAMGGQNAKKHQALAIQAEGGPGAPGVYGESSTEFVAGAHGIGEALGGAYGISDHGPGVHGLNTLLGPGGFFTSQAGPGLIAESTQGAGIDAAGDVQVGLWANSTSGDAAVGTSTQGMGVAGYSSKGDGGYFWTKSTAPGTAAIIASNAQATPAGGVVGLRVNGDCIDENGTKQAALPTSKGLTLLYIVEATTSVFEDIGKAQLRNGRARVELDPLFVETIETRDYQVFLTARGDNRGLFVATRDERGFEIQEQAGGTSSIEISYRVVAQRKGLRPNHRLARFEPPSPPKPPELTRPKPAKLHQPNLGERPNERDRPERRSR